MTGVFLVALLKKDNSIVDVAYGGAFVLVSGLIAFFYGESHLRQILILSMITIWGLRLSLHIYFRKKTEKGEDFRYRKWRESWGNSFVWRSYLQIFMLQGAVIYLMLLPLLIVIDQPGGSFHILDFVGISVWFIGFLFETIGDWQLLRFKKNPKNKGRILRSGLWKWTRHPNYFGEALLWWGVFFVSLNSPNGTFAIISPILIGFLLLRISGVPLLESKYIESPEFKSYKAKTSRFFPWFPKRGEAR